MSTSVTTKDSFGKLSGIQQYLINLYDAYDSFHADYKRLHKRSKYHNKERMHEYYMRWRDNMREEIRRVEAKVAINRIPYQDEQYFFEKVPSEEIRKGRPKYMNDSDTNHDNRNDNKTA